MRAKTLNAITKMKIFEITTAIPSVCSEVSSQYIIADLVPIKIFQKKPNIFYL